MACTYVIIAACFFLFFYLYRQQSSYNKSFTISQLPNSCTDKLKSKTSKSTSGESDRQKELRRRKGEEKIPNGYDLRHDTRYNLWLEVNHHDCDTSTPSRASSNFCIYTEWSFCVYCEINVVCYEYFSRLSNT